MRISDWSSDVCSSDLTLSKNDVTLPTPKFSGTAAVRAILPIHPLDGELAFNADLYHTSAYDAQFGNSLPGYNVVNSRLELSHIGGRDISIAAYVRNLFDTIGRASCRERVCQYW